ncbi:hypothetical protein [Pontibacter burrus]|uniref:Uncharacterized protein n=1 Tax=Pontibacter burrus TaxID=2704466 RepID=A0A6B3LJI7_9BACT|nr:hypothetical protein [Pontibacter burrus]NEM97152.1 hypothetical protein [Pontibacter burrus]
MKKAELSLCFQYHLRETFRFPFLQIVIGVIAKESAAGTAIIIAVIAIDALAISTNSMQQLLANRSWQRKCNCYGSWLMHVVNCTTNMGFCSGIANAELNFSRTGHKKTLLLEI